MLIRSPKFILLVLVSSILLLSQLPLLITTFWPIAHQGKVQSHLYLPDQASPDKPAPLIVVFGGSEGGMPLAHSKSASQRRHYLDAGFALLTIGYFGLADTPAGLDRIELTSIITAIDNAAALPRVRAENITLLGTSKGAELALLLASRNSNISTVVSVVGADAVFGSSEWYSTSSSWAWQQQPVPFVPIDLRSVLPTLIHGDLRRSYELAMQNHSAYQQAKIPVEQMKADVLFISGTADEVWPSSEMSDRMMARLQQHQYPFAYQHLKIEGAGHGGLGNKYQPEIMAFIKQSQQR
jgi:uncharacterized protein